MKITVAKTAGFCMGVRRAVDMVLDAANQTDEAVYTYGPLIHNPQVLEMLQDKGISQLDKMPEKGNGIVLIRAHGVPPSDEINLKSAGFSVVNATCPRVIRVQTIIEKHASRGYSTIIVGDKNHPEVIGLLGYTKNMGTTVSSLEQLKQLPLFEKAVVVAQTTQNKALYDQIKEWCKKNAVHYELFDTICGSTRKRQKETQDLALKNDAVIVVGGKQSGNTRRLAQVAAQTGIPAFHIEDVAELDFSELQCASSIAITAGASTPNWIILDTFAKVRKKLYSHRPLVHWVSQLFGFLLTTNLLLAAGAGSMTYACCKLQKIPNIFEFSIISTCYVLSMHILNNIFTTTSDVYNHPERASFYLRYKTFLGLVALSSGVIGLSLACAQEWMCFAILLIMILLGLTYNRMKMPMYLEKMLKKRFVKDITGSKTILISLAWGIVTSILPAITHDKLTVLAIPCFLYTAGLAFARTVFFDILAIQGDRISGKETLPIFLGEKKSFRLIKKILAAELAVIMMLPVLGMTPWGVFIAFSTLPFFMILLINTSAKDTFLSGGQYECLIDGSFLLTGLLMALAY